MCSPRASASIRSICGRCRCSIATAGAFPGRFRSSQARMCVCAGCVRAWSMTRLPNMRITHHVRRAHRDVHTDQRTDEEERRFTRRIEFITAAAPPPEAVLAAMTEAGFNVTHVYGLTETYGPAVVNEWKSEWDALDKGPRAAKKARQGVRYHALDALSVHGPADDGARARRRRDARRSDVPRQYRDEGISEESQGDDRRPLQAAGSIPAISACCIPTAMCS